MACFHRRVQRFGSVRKGAVQIAFPTPKVGVTRTEPKFELHTPSVDWSIESHFRATGG